jgi:hypothetical protein
MLIPARFQTNAYRVLRAPAASTASEMHHAAIAIRRAVTLGLATLTAEDIPTLGPLSRSETALREAIGRMENPAQRLRDRLFWFHGTPTIEASTLAPIEKAHDNSLRDLFASLEASLDDTTLWTAALRQWHQQVVSQPDYWACILRIEEQGGFEPIAHSSELADLRRNALAYAAEPIEMAARDALATGNLTAVQRTLAALNQLHDTGPWAEASSRELISPLVNRVHDTSQAVKDELHTRIVYKSGFGSDNLPICDEQLKAFRNQIEPAVNTLIVILPPEQEDILVLRGEAASALHRIAICYTWADEYALAEDLCHEAISLVRDTVAAIGIEGTIGDIHDDATKQRVERSIPPAAHSDIKAIRDGCAEVYANSKANLIQENGKAAHNQIVCNQELAVFRNQIQPAWKRLLLVAPADHPTVLEMRQKVASCLLEIAMVHTWANYVDLVVELLEEAAEIGRGTTSEPRIEEKLAEYRKSSIRNRFYQELKPIGTPPKIRRTGPLAHRLIGRADYDDVNNSWVATIYFAIFGLPLLPITRVRLAPDDTAPYGYKFFGSMALGRFANLYFTAFVWFVMFIILAPFVIMSILHPSPPQPPALTVETQDEFAARMANAVGANWAANRAREIQQAEADAEAAQAALNSINEQIAFRQHELALVTREIQARDAEAIPASPDAIASRQMLHQRRDQLVAEIRKDKRTRIQLTLDLQKKQDIANDRHILKVTP